LDAPGRYAFAHALVRETLYAELSAARRARLHAAIGAALEASPTPNDRVEELAHHFTEAATLGDPERAVAHSTRAGEQALRLVAGLESVATRLEGESSLRARVLARLAIELSYAGQEERRDELSRQAVALARAGAEPAAVPAALGARHVALWGPDHADGRLAVA